MRVCVVYAGATRQAEKLKGIADAVARGIQSQGHEVDVFNMGLEAGTKLTFYDYIVVGTEATGTWGGKIPSAVGEFFKSAGSLEGKRCMAFIRKAGMRTQRTLSVLMKAMEQQGMYLRTSDIFSKAEEAEAAGRRLIISK